MRKFMEYFYIVFILVSGQDAVHCHVVASFRNLYSANATSYAGGQ